MYQVLAAKGYLPVNYTAEIPQAAGVRREAFVCPPSGRNTALTGRFSGVRDRRQEYLEPREALDYWAIYNII